MYFILLVFLVLCSVFEYYKKSKSCHLTCILFMIMTALLCFRYGQGTDYFGYYKMYYKVGLPHGEVAYSFMADMAFKMGLHYEAFVFVQGLLLMWLAWRFIKKYCPCPALSLSVLYPTIYLTYFFSAVRQGIVIALFLGVMFQLLYEDKYLRYLGVGIIAGMFHTSGFLLLLLLPIKKIRFCYIYIGIGISLLLGLLLFVPAVHGILVNVPYLSFYIKNSEGIYIWGILERLSILVFIHILYYRTADENKEGVYELLFKIYLIGFMIYAVFISDSFIASRFFAIFKCVEVALLPLGIYYLPNLKRIALSVLMGYVCLMEIKNVNSYIQQGDYIGINAITYPYISTFNRERITDFYSEERLQSVLNLMEEAQNEGAAD